ncbi:DUF2182 domain-containing protein [Arthrobacter sp. NPDC058288]|uniref:DUF2182 domain-containing protein n=1 Tax=Arthrobacter sp. NPDC058288 TaxID=3346424 RepID=UPI0036E77C64
MPHWRGISFSQASPACLRAREPWDWALGFLGRGDADDGGHDVAGSGASHFHVPQDHSCRPQPRSPGRPDNCPVLAVAAGVYQLTPLKDFCLRHCRSPVAFLLHLSGYKGRLRDVRVGMYVPRSVYCVCCCWGLMVVLIAVGMMNLAWMAVLTVV